MYFSNNGRCLYVLSTGHTLPEDDPVQGQTVIYVFEVNRKCGLNVVQMVSDGLPNQDTTVFGVVGITFSKRISPPSLGA